MGHYYSELYTKEEIRIKNELKERQRQKLLSGIRLAISKNGVEHVLADIIEKSGNFLLRQSYENHEG